MALKCVTCGLLFRSRNELDWHVRQEHLQKRLPPTKDSQRRPRLRPMTNPATMPVASHVVRRTVRTSVRDMMSYLRPGEHRPGEERTDEERSSVPPSGGNQ